MDPLESGSSGGRPLPVMAIDSSASGSLGGRPLPVVAIDDDTRGSSAASFNPLPPPPPLPPTSTGTSSRRSSLGLQPTQEEAGQSSFASLGEVGPAHPPQGFKAQSSLVTHVGQYKAVAQQAAKDAWSIMWDRGAPLASRWQGLLVSIYLFFDFPSSSLWAKLQWRFMVVAILLNSMLIIVRTMEAFHTQPTTCAFPVCSPGDGTGLCTEIVCHPVESKLITDLNIATVCVFAVDYLARLFTVHAVPGELLYSRELPFDLAGRPVDHSHKHSRGGWSKTWHWATSFIPIIDLTSIVPAIIILAYPDRLAAWSPNTRQDTTAGLVVKLFRVVRILKLARFNKGFLVFKRALQASLPAFRFFFFFCCVMVFGFGQLIYLCEKGQFRVTAAHPKGAFLRPAFEDDGALEVSPFTSMAAGMYWVVVNTTPLKVSGFAPSTAAGKWVAVAAAFVSFLLVALPIAIVSKHFSEQYVMLYDACGRSLVNAHYHSPLRPKGQWRQQQRQQQQQRSGWISWLFP